ncbi:MAG: GGDEF domain-containing protein, partial [Wujia sp.]
IAGHEGNDFSETRLNCYKKVLKENGIEYDETRVGYGNFWEGPTREVMQKFFDDPRGIPEAIICCNDVMAMTASQMLQEHGYRIPEDVLITGFDGIEAEKYASPRLTTAVTDFDSFSIKVMDVLDALAYNKDIPEDIKVGFKYRVAQSCGCKAVNAYEAASKITELYGLMSYSRGHEEFMFSYLSESLGCKKYKELAKTAAKHCELMHIWVCLNRDYFKNERLPKYNGKFTEDMILFYQVNNTKLLDFCKEYKFEEYLPDFDKILETSDVLMFTVIHYQSTVYGYAVSEINIEKNEYDYIQRYLNNTIQILESVHKSVQLNAAYAEMKVLHQRDPLTTLYNRRGFQEECVGLLRQCKANKKPMIIVSIDLDNLKTINDVYGHAMGDVAISTTAKFLLDFAKDQAICARFGGDEYVVLAATDDIEEYERSINCFIDNEIGKFNATGQHPYKLQLSMGCAEVINYNMDGVHTALRFADARMYEQKRKHKEKLLNY